MSAIRVFYKDCKTPFGDILNLIHASFKERLDAGLNFSCATYSIEDFKRHTKNSHIFVAYDLYGNIVGTLTLTLRERFGYKCASHEFLAVSDQSKGKGVASALFKVALSFSIREGICFLISTTATTAYTSINYHKRNGFKAYKLEQFEGKNYYSYCFIRPITKFKIFNYDIIRYPIFLVSAFICRITKKLDTSNKVLL